MYIYINIVCIKVWLKGGSFATTAAIPARDLRGGSAVYERAPPRVPGICAIFTGL